MDAGARGAHGVCCYSMDSSSVVLLTLARCPRVPAGSPSSKRQALEGWQRITSGGKGASSSLSSHAHVGTPPWGGLKPRADCNMEWSEVTGGGEAGVRWSARRTATDTSIGGDAACIFISSVDRAPSRSDN